MDIFKLLVLAAVIWIILKPVETRRCAGLCECDEDFSIVDCQNRALRFVPDLSGLTHYDELNLRHNKLTFVDFAKLKEFRLINILDNPLNCVHGLMNVDALTPFNIVLSDCTIPGVNTRYPPSERHVTTSSEVSSDYGETQSEISVTTAVDRNDAETEKVSLAGGLLGEADAFTKGKLEIAWGISTSLTIVGILGGVITCWTLAKIMRKLKDIDTRMRRADDFHAAPPAQKGFNLFEDLSSRVSAAFSSSVAPSSSETSNDTDPKPSGSKPAPNGKALWQSKKAQRVNFTWDAFGGSSSEEENGELDNLYTSDNGDDNDDDGDDQGNAGCVASKGKQLPQPSRHFFKINPAKFEAPPASETLSQQLADISISQDASNYRTQPQHSSDSE